MPTTGASLLEVAITLKIARFLGQPASTLLTSEPFVNWPVTRSVDDHSEPPETRFVFEGLGLELICDRDSKEKINTLFMTRETNGGTRLSEVSFDSSRDNVLRRFGIPSRSGEKSVDPILGENGPWDRFQNAEFAIHFQYEFDADRIRMITLMRNDVVP